MADLKYPAIIEKDSKFTALADLGKRLNSLDKSQIMTSFVDLVPKEYLHLLAEKWSVTGYDGWLLANSEETKRKLIKNAVNLHRYKGTPWAIREVIRQLGFGEVTLIERLSGYKRDGSIQRNAKHYHGSGRKWAHYRIVMNNAITIEQARLLQKVLYQYAPARCVLESLDYQQVANLHNGKIKRNGQHTRGMFKLNND